MNNKIILALLCAVTILVSTFANWYNFSFSLSPKNQAVTETKINPVALNSDNYNINQALSKDGSVIHEDAILTSELFNNQANPENTTVVQEDAILTSELFNN